MCMRVTSSTAQGGGGSSKNRKPSYRRGWLLWVTDGRAKRLMDRQVVEVSSLSLSFSLFLSLSLTTYLPTSLPPYLPASLPTYLPTTYLPTYPPTHPPSYLPTDNIKNETILRDVLQKWTVECRADGLEPMRFAFFPVHLSKVLRCHEKVMPGHMPLVLRLPRKMHLCRSSSNVPRLPSFLEMLQNPHVLLTFDKVRNPLRLPREATSEPPKVVRTPTACTFSTSQLPKVVPAWCVFNILTSKSASRHNGVHFFDISTSKSHPNLLCFVHFDFEVCFAPQQRALSRHLNFQKWSKNGVLCTFWLGNVLRATTACNF